MIKESLTGCNCASSVLEMSKHVTKLISFNTGFSRLGVAAECMLNHTEYLFVTVTNVTSAIFSKSMGKDRLSKPSKTNGPQAYTAFKFTAILTHQSHMATHFIHRLCLSTAYLQPFTCSNIDFQFPVRYV